MKSGFIQSAIMIVLVLGCLGLGSAQTVSNDLLQTGSGSQEDLSSLGLGTVTFQGVPLSTDTGGADTIVQHVPITSAGTITIQVIALHLQNSSTVTCNNQSKCGSFFGQSVEVHATINVTSATGGHITLPQPDNLNASSGSMTVATGLASFSSSFTNIQADIIVVPVGAGVNGTRIFTAPGPSASMSANGGTLSSTAPSGYPNSQNFPTVGEYVISLASSGAMLVTGPGARIFHGTLWALGCVLLGLALLMFRNAMKSGRMNLRPVYMTGLALAAWFVAWKAPTYPKIVYANGMPSVGTSCGSVSAEQGALIAHHAAPARTGLCTSTVTLSGQ